MAPTPWTAPAIAHAVDQPATLAGLTSAVRQADQAARLLVESGSDDEAIPVKEVSGECADARTCLERSARRIPPQPAPLEPPAGPLDPAHVRALEPVLAACIELAADVLDNEDEPLEIRQVTAIGQAIAHLDTARRLCWEVAL